RADRCRRPGDAARSGQELRARRAGVRPRGLRARGEEIRERGELSAETRRRLAGKGFAHTSGYDAAMPQWLSGDDLLPERLTVSFSKQLDLAYGENPHQRAAYYHGPGTHLLFDVEKLHGRDLSFINLYDLAAARALLEELGDEPACVIVKHANPCG